MTDESMRKTIAGNISRYRKQLGMTQLDLSEKINYSDKSISKWERGDGIPDVPTMVQLAEIFGVSVDDLIYPPRQPRQPVESEEPEKSAKPGDSTDGRFCWRHIFHHSTLHCRGVAGGNSDRLPVPVHCAGHRRPVGRQSDVLCGDSILCGVPHFCQSLVATGVDLHCHFRHRLGCGAVRFRDIFRDLRRRRDLRPCRHAGTAGAAVLFLALLCKASVAHPVSVPKEKIKQVRKAQYCNCEMDFRCIVMKSFPYCGTVPFFVRESKILKWVEWFCTGVGGFYLKKGVY